MANLSLRGLDDETLVLLPALNFGFRAILNHQRGVSVNRRIIELLRKQMGTIQKHQCQQTHHDLDKLAGTWSDQDAKEFSETIAPFSEIDATLWQ